MFTIEQINHLHDRLGVMQTPPDYLRALNAIGVVRFDSYLGGGHSEFFGSDGQRIDSEPAHEMLTITSVADTQRVVEHLSRHQRGETGYVEMSKALAASGVEKWTMDTNALTVTYLDTRKNAVIFEPLQ